MNYIRFRRGLCRKSRWGISQTP